MLTLHHLNNSRSQRILWVLEELGLPYEIKFYQRNQKTWLAPEELKKIHPLGKSPVITDNGLVLAESAAILEYLVDRYGQGRLKPRVDSEQWIRYRYWLHYAEGSLMPLLVLALIFNRIRNQKVPFFVRPILKGICEKVMKVFVYPQLKLHLSYVEEELAKSSWFCGDELTAADIQMSFPLSAALIRAPAEFIGPNIRRFIQQVNENKNYQMAIQKGGAFDL